MERFKAWTIDVYRELSAGPFALLDVAVAACGAERTASFMFVVATPDAAVAARTARAAMAQATSAVPAPAALAGAPAVSVAALAGLPAA